MEQAQAILVVILGIALFLLLALSLVVVFLLIKILTNIRRVTQRVDETSQNMGEMFKYVGRKVGPAAVTAIASVMLRSVKNSFKRRK